MLSRTRRRDHVVVRICRGILVATCAFRLQQSRSPIMSKEKRRQASQPWQTAAVAPALNGEQRVSARVHDHGGGKGHPTLSRSRSKNKKSMRSVPWKRDIWIGAFVVLLLLAMVLTSIRSFQGEDLPSWFPGSDHEESDFDFLADGIFQIRTRSRLSSQGNAQHLSLGELKEEIKEQADDKPKKKTKHPAVPCEIDFKNSTSDLRQPADFSEFESFNLNYIQVEKKPEDSFPWKARFGGHQSLRQREASYIAQDQTVHCGLIEGPDGYPETGFDLAEDDKKYLQTCQIAVSSCIFGNYDHLRNPRSKKISVSSKERVCFAMFVDQTSLNGLIQEGELRDGNRTSGLWRIILIRTLPYHDNRRTGKIPKLLTHRLFPNARYSIWLDSKLRLQSDPLLILEHFLWSGQHEYAISNHYDRHCVWEEVAQNKKLNKFSHRVIDEQFEFYKNDGLPRFNASDRHKLLPSHVPEGSFIVRAHTPMSNLFSCLWYNEVERFTPRDQLSFAYTYLKLVRTNPSKRFRFKMFKDCERRKMAQLYHHKAEEAAKH